MGETVKGPRSQDKTLKHAQVTKSCREELEFLIFIRQTQSFFSWQFFQIEKKKQTTIVGAKTKHP